MIRWISRLFAFVTMAGIISGCGDPVREFPTAALLIENDQGARVLSPWESPPGVEFTSKTAENWRFGCAQRQEILQLDSSATSDTCIYLA